MLRHECHGRDRKPKPVPQEAECPHCGAEIEMWSTDTKVTCPKCSKEIACDQLHSKK